jgi:uncharacterized protein (DUF58 family)
MRDVEKWIVRENRIYIMPTANGALYLAGIVVLILTASTYNNNLIFILAFFLFAVFFVSMIQTHYNLKGVRLQYNGSEEGFQGDRVSLNFYIIQKRSRTKKALQVRTRSKTFVTLKNARENLQPQDGMKTARIEVRAWRRGIHPVPSVVLETQYPLGLFRSWKVFRPEGEIIVYPAPEPGPALLPRAYDQGEQDQGLRTSPDGDFGELKSYLPGESYHQIAWKHYARTGTLYTKVHWGAEDRHYVIPWNPGRDLEKYLETMSGWVKQAHDENASFEMETPVSSIQPGRGREHAKICWRALAMVPPQKAAK